MFTLHPIHATIFDGILENIPFMPVMTDPHNVGKPKSESRGGSVVGVQIYYTARYHLLRSVF